MPDQTADAKSANMAKANANWVAGAMIIGAALLVFIGTMAPVWADLTGPEGTWLSLAFYAGAAGEVGIAFYLRALIRKAQRNANSGGGTIQRQ